jgi:hypothetical protein
MEDLLRSVLEVKDTDSHEVLEALSFSNPRIWLDFMKLEDKDVEDLSKSAPIRGNNARASIGTRLELISFMRMITKQCENKDPRASDISSYNAKDIQQYYYEHKKNLQIKVLQGTPTASATTMVSNRHVRSESKKAIYNWNRGKRQKTAFPVLRDNN